MSNGDWLPATERTNLSGNGERAACGAGGLPLAGRRALLSASLGLLAFATGCGRGKRDESGVVGTDGWPRRLQDDRGTVIIPRPPRRIVSTSVTLTGTLLALGAPVVGSAATRAGTQVADDRGFFRQWSAVARETGLASVYTGAPQIEAVAAMAPDLIVVARTGGDSALRIVDQLEAIAPVLVLDYGNKDWQELAAILGRATGREAAAQAARARYDARVRALVARLRLPPQPVTAMVYYEDGSGANLWTPASAQGKLLTALGFRLAGLPPSVPTVQAMGRRNDIWQVTGERFADALMGETILLFAANDAVVQSVCANRFLAHVPAVRAGRVYAMGPETFRLDYYSGLRLLDRIESLFAR